MLESVPGLVTVLYVVSSVLLGVERFGYLFSPLFVITRLVHGVKELLYCISLDSVSMELDWLAIHIIGHEIYEVTGVEIPDSPGVFSTPPDVNCPILNTRHV